MFVALKDKSIQTHSMNGKQIEKFSGAHATEIRGLEFNNVLMGGHIATISADACILWTNSGTSVCK